MNRKWQFCGIAGLIFFIFGLLTEFVLLADAGLFVPLHLGAGFLLIILFLLNGGISALKDARVVKKAGAGAGVTIYVILFVAVLSMVNYLSARHEFFRFDSTEQKVYTLAPQTKKILDSLEQEVVFRGFYLAGIVEPDVKSLMNLLTTYSDKVKWEVIDPEKQPLLVEKYGINEAGTIHLAFSQAENSRSVKVARNTEEQDIVNAILKLTRGGNQVVYYSTGHGEPSLELQTEAGFLFLEESIEGENIELKEFQLSSAENIPEDAAAFILAAPEKDLLPKELSSIQRYLEQGGNAIFLYEAQKSQSYKSVLSELAVDVYPNVIVDQVIQLFSGPSLGVQPVITQYVEHEIIQGFSEGTMFSIASALKINEDAKRSALVSPLALTSETSWAESNVGLLFSDEPQAALEETDQKGPLVIAAAYDGSEQEEGENYRGRVVVVGDSDFVSNALIRQFYNRDLFLNALNWVVGQNEQVSIRQRSLRASTQTLGADQFGVMFLLSVIVLPELLLLFGLAVWWSRR